MLIILIKRAQTLPNSYIKGKGDSKTGNLVARGKTLGANTISRKGTFKTKIAISYILLERLKSKYKFYSNQGAYT